MGSNSRATPLSRFNGTGSFDGIGGPVSSDLATALYHVPEKPMLLNFMAGLGGRDISKKDIISIFDQAIKAAETEEVTQKLRWVGLKTSLVGD